jgi:hypothetical protein
MHLWVERNPPKGGTGGVEMSHKRQEHERKGRGKEKPGGVPVQFGKLFGSG